ncbi:UNVERIFIED_CONTAM: hypothetical protein FKN15_071292 [Acipenser sinensis]
MCGLNTDVSKVKDTRLLTFKAIAHCFIMGCSWILGFFQGLEFFRFVFVIINSLQGPFIFLVHCVLNQQVRSHCLHLPMLCYYPVFYRDTLELDHWSCKLQ